LGPQSSPVAFAVSLYFVVVRRVGAARSSLVPLFFPVVAVVLGAVVLGEKLPLEAFIGLASFWRARSLSAAVRLQPPLKRKRLDAMSILGPKCQGIS